MSDNKLTVVVKDIEWSHENAVNGAGVLGTAQSLGDEYLS